MATIRRTKTKRKTTRRTQRRGLSGTVSNAPRKGQLVDALKESGLILLAAVAGGGAGAAVGKHSLILGLPATIYGIYKKNNYLTAGGLGIVLSNGFQFKKADQTTEGLGEMDVKQIAEDAKERVMTFFKNFGDKLYISRTDEGTAALGENEQVTYFINPYGTGELDLSELDRIQAQVAEMNRPGDMEGIEYREF